MVGDERMTERERGFLEKGVLASPLDGRGVYRKDLWKAGGADRLDVAYLTAYRALHELDPDLAAVVAERYLARELAYVAGLKDRKETALVDQDFDRAAELRTELDSYKSSASQGIQDLLNAAAEGIARLSAGPKEE